MHEARERHSARMFDAAAASVFTVGLKFSRALVNLDDAALEACVIRVSLRIAADHADTAMSNAKKEYSSALNSAEIARKAKKSAEEAIDKANKAVENATGDKEKREKEQQRTKVLDTNERKFALEDEAEAAAVEQAGEKIFQQYVWGFQVCFSMCLVHNSKLRDEYSRFVHERPLARACMRMSACPHTHAHVHAHIRACMEHWSAIMYGALECYNVQARDTHGA